MKSSETAIPLRSELQTPGVEQLLSPRWQIFHRRTGHTVPSAASSASSSARQGESQLSNTFCSRHHAPLFPSASPTAHHGCAQQCRPCRPRLPLVRTDAASPTGSEAALRRRGHQGLPHRRRRRRVPDAHGPPDSVSPHGSHGVWLRWPLRPSRRRRLLSTPSPAARARPAHARHHTDLPPAAHQLPDAAMGPRPRQRRLYSPRVPPRR